MRRSASVPAKATFFAGTSASLLEADVNITYETGPFESPTVNRMTEVAVSSSIVVSGIAERLRSEPVGAAAGWTSGEFAETFTHTSIDSGVVPLFATGVIWMPATESANVLPMSRADELGFGTRSEFRWRLGLHGLHERRTPFASSPGCGRYSTQ